MSVLRALVLPLALALAACAGTPARNASPRSAGGVDDAAVGALYARLDAAVRRYEEGLALAAGAGAAHSGNAVGAALDELRAAALQCHQTPVQLLEDLQRRVGVQVKVGEAARLELVRAEAEVATARIQLESGRLRLKTARAALHAAIGAPNGVEFDPRDSLHPPVPLPALDVLRRQVLGAHPSVALADNELRRADSRLALERELLKPQPTVWADMFRQPDVTQYRAGVTLPIPLWNKRQGPIAEAVAAQRQTAAIADMRRLEIQAALEAAYGQYEVASQQVTMFEAGTLKEAEAAVSAAEAAFRFGERGILEVLDAQRVLRGARLEYLNAQFDRESALIALEQLGAIEPRSKKP